MPVTYNETQSTTLTEMSYATVSVTQYVYIDSYAQGQVLENATIQQISNGSEVSAHFDKGDEHDVQTITIGVINNATNVKITIATAPQHTNLGMNTNEYGSFEILATNLSDNNIKSVVIEFKVEKSWLSNNQIPQDKVSLYRLENGAWRELQTSLTKTDETYAYYEAISPGLSIFAIAGQSTSLLQIPWIGPIPNSYAIILPLTAVAITGIYGGIRIKRSRSKSTDMREDNSPDSSLPDAGSNSSLPGTSPESSLPDTRSEPQIEGRLLEYITKHGGSISLKKTAEDLGVPLATVKEAISHLKNGGKLAPA
jgi:PGF-pre-PGF domain-containing protein